MEKKEYLDISNYRIVDNKLSSYPFVIQIDDNAFRINVNLELRYDRISHIIINKEKFIVTKCRENMVKVHEYYDIFDLFTQIEIQLANNNNLNLSNSLINKPRDFLKNHKSSLRYIFDFLFLDSENRKMEVI